MSYQFRIQQVTFSDTTTLNLPDLTVIVGANNSGKSRALKDILNLNCSPNKDGIVVLRAAPTLPKHLADIAASYDIAPKRDVEGYFRFRFLSPKLDKETQTSYGDPSYKWPDNFEGIMANGNSFSSYLISQLMALLTTEDRLSLVSKKESAREPRQISNLMQLLYAAGREQEMRIRKIITEAFSGIEIALDFSVPQQLQFRVGNNFDALPSDPRDAAPILLKCGQLDEQGDGLRSYTGIVVALTTLKRPVFLIDEPEAFLHPPQAFRLGRFIASQAKSGCQIIVATHSTDILRGIIYHSKDALIVRMDRLDDKNTVKAFAPAELKPLVIDPLLSAAGVLNGLFYSKIIVTEADADSRFYQSLSSKANLGLDTHFVNADNKQTVPKVLAPYKQVGVRCAGIVDIDVLNDAEEFNKQLKAAGITGDKLEEAQKARQKIDEEVRTVPAATRLTTALNQISAVKIAADKALAESPQGHEKAIEQFQRELDRIKADASKWQAVKKDGVTALKATRPEFERLYQICSAAGLFINPCGELEASLSELGLKWQADKRDWIERALQLIPNLQPNLSIQPWKFISEVHAYLQQPARN